ncbi:MAG TPA: hydrogenase formation protein HypD, partial [Actinomycetes bacterium]|nr:hydrogenase formation protein HypD [Actinomycetes bacterium]
MRYVDEFRDAEKAQALAAQIAMLCEPGRQYKFMEVCGGHTHTIYKHGLEDYLPESITLVHGPGCPVCVIPMGRVDDAIFIAQQPDVIMTSFGDMMRVPGSHGAFFDATARGADIRMVYSPLDSLKIAALCEPGRQYKFMEVCGGHTHTIYKHGLEDYLPESITLVHGPGCPVCVIPMGRVDDAIFIASQPDVIMTSFGDMMRVPGSNGAFFDATARGADIRMVYSPLDSLKIARQNPDKRVVFMAIGFETTAPSSAMTVLRAKATGIENFSIFCNHVTIIPAIKAILDSPDLRLDGFIGPGHVSTVIGCRPYEFIAGDYGKPLVCAGFEPLDLLQSIYMLMRQLAEGRSEVENQYTRVVPWDG